MNYRVLQLTSARFSTWDGEDVAKAYGVQKIPTMLFFKDGQVVDYMIGIAPKDDILIRFVRSIAGKMPQSGKERLPEIIAAIKNNQQLNRI